MWIACRRPLAILAKYHSMLNEEHPKEFDMGKELLKDTDSRIITLAQEYALKKVTKDLEQLFQELEYKFNSHFFKSRRLSFHRIYFRSW